QAGGVAGGGVARGPAHGTERGRAELGGPYRRRRRRCWTAVAQAVLPDEGSAVAGVCAAQRALGRPARVDPRGVDRDGESLLVSRRPDLDRPAQRARRAVLPEIGIAEAG